MEINADDSSSLLSMLLLGLIFFVIIILVLPQLGNLSSNQSETFDDDQDGEFSRTLQEIFLEYRHSSVSDWINWITHQDVSKKNAAFEHLVAYLEHVPEGIGSLITDVIKAVIAFAYPESFTSLHQLIENVRKHWGSYHTADQFYAQAVLGLVELNQERSQSLLITEFELIKHKRNPQRFMIAILDALSKLPDDAELNDFWFKVLVDPLCELPVKEHVIEIIADKDIDSRLSVIAPFFKFWNKPEIVKISNNDLRIIENIFYANQDLIINDNYELWDLVLDACKQKVTETLFVNLVVSILENKKIDINESLLIQLFDSGHTIRSEFLETLAVKQKLSTEELDMIQEGYFLDIEKDQDIIDIIKFQKGNKDVATSLEDTYEYCIRILSLDQELKNQSFPVLNFIPGGSSRDKYYLIECLAANHQYKLLSVNLAALLGSITELAKFKLLITQNKPCLIYFYGLGEIIDRKLSDIEISNIEVLNKLFNEFKVIIGVNFLVDIETSYEDLNTNTKLQVCLKKIFHIKYGMIKDIDKPDLLSRQKILNDHIKKLTPSRINSSAGLELIAKETEDYSLVEFLAYINSYMRFCLLVYGELKSPADLYQDLMLTDQTNQEEEAV